VGDALSHFGVWLILLFNRLKGMSVDDFLGAGFMEEGSDEVNCPIRDAPGIQCFQEEDLEGIDSDEEEDDNDELEDDGSLPSVDDLDGAWDTGVLSCVGACSR
jgi:nucleolar complex protein 2